MELKITSNFSKVKEKFEQIKQEVAQKQKSWVSNCTQRFYAELVGHLGTQGRGGELPLLSGMTKHIYSIDGEPDGSALVNQIKVSIKKTDRGYIGVVGIAEGKATTIARVQDQGATISVTDAMRGFLAANYGIHLRKDTKVIYVPGRRFWRLSVAATRKYAKSRLTHS